LIVVVVCVLVAVSTAPGAVALFTDGDASTANTVAAGTLDLKLSEVGPATQDSTTDETKEDAVADTGDDLTHDETLGEPSVNNTLTLDNSRSSLDANRVNVTVSYAENDSAVGTPGNADRTARRIQINEFVYNGTDLVGSKITDENGNERIDIEDLEFGDTKRNLSSLSGVASGSSVDMTVSFEGERDLLTGVTGGDGIDITVEVRAHASFVDRDVSSNNTIRYAVV
jgi:hypothetical protein